MLTLICCALLVAPAFRLSPAPAQDAPLQMMTYQLVLLKKGLNAPPAEPAAQKAMQDEHLARMAEQNRKGLNLIYGPILADADIRGHRGYFDYLVMLYRSRLARDAGDAEQARVCIRDAVNRLLLEGRVVYLLEVLPEAVAVLHALDRPDAGDALCGQLLAWQRTMDPPMLPTAWAVLQESCDSASMADGWPEPDSAAAVQRLANDVLSALS